MYQDFADNLVLEPDVEEPSAEEIAERGIRVWDGAIQDADQPGSPESMAKWRIHRLTRRIVVSCVERRPAMCRFMAMRETLREVLRSCSRSQFNRSRAMVMMHEIEDLSEHESSVDDEPQDPFQYMFSGIPDGDHLYEQILLDDDDCVKSMLNELMVHLMSVDWWREQQLFHLTLPSMISAIILHLMKIFQQMQSWKNMVLIGICIMFHS